MGASQLMESMNAYNCAPSGLVAANEDLFNGDPASDVISMANYRSIIFLIAKNAGATGTATITVESCDDVTPSTTTAIPFTYRATTSGNAAGAVTAATAAGFTTTAGADQLYEIEIDAADLGTDDFVRLQCTEVVDSPVDGAIICILGGARYGHEDVTA